MRIIQNEKTRHYIIRHEFFLRKKAYSAYTRVPRLVSGRSDAEARKNGCDARA